ncbi:MAG: insulinase family protein, partial [Calditrichaeota bacterium]|nr:insulinase family protein [Calditrichota bacterium]
MSETGMIKNGFRVVCLERIPEIDSNVRILQHDKSGAHLMHIENDDDNKVFAAAFLTPPDDDTGLTHILEHCVLSGSRKFPVKEPMMEAVKGSLKTFINAFTMPLITMYPVASVNDKDFHNLMDIYLDAVFFPRIYDYDEIMMQEGWHYELTKPEDKIIYKGVVFNEMKGVFSDPESYIDRQLAHSLFPSTAY